MNITSIAGTHGDIPDHRAIVVQPTSDDCLNIHYLKNHVLVTITYDEAIVIRDSLNIIYPPRSLSNCNLPSRKDVVPYRYAHTAEAPGEVPIPVHRVDVPELQLDTNTHRHPRMG